MKTRKEYRKIARETLEGNWGNAVLTTLVMLVIGSIFNSAFQYGGVFAFQPILGANYAGMVGSGTSIIGTIICLPIAFAYYVMLLGLVRGGQIAVSGLFKYYNYTVLKTMVLKLVYLILWMCLLIVPGIIKSYSYAMTEYIMVDNPELSGNAAIEESMRMMKGHKMELFLLDLSFIGWILLVILTMGLGALLLEPYIYATRAAYYEDLKAETV